jgi:hypothetical protein
MTAPLHHQQILMRRPHSRAQTVTAGPGTLRKVTLLALALLAAILLMTSQLTHAAVAISVNIAPPPLPVYEQPPIPAPGYMWIPGYWAYSPEGYYWVPGTWVLPPDPELVWTPGYWAWSDGVYAWNAGYWGPTVGFYGGIDYGFGYPGRGYDGGYWRNRQFYYNRAVTNISNTNITNVYSRTVVNNVNETRVSYSGGPGGVTARPTPQEEQAGHAQRHAPTSVQTQHAAAASRQHELLASVNHGSPPVAATPKPNEFGGAGVVHARGAGSAPGTFAPRAETQRQAEQRQPNAERQTEQRQEPPRRLAEAPRPAPAGPHAIPQHPAPAERTAPQPSRQEYQRPPQERPQAPQERPQAPQERPQAPQERPQAPQERPQPRAEQRKEPQQRQPERRPEENGRPPQG